MAKKYFHIRPLCNIIPVVPLFRCPAALVSQCPGPPVSQYPYVLASASWCPSNLWEETNLSKKGGIIKMHEQGIMSLKRTGGGTEISKSGGVETHKGRGDE